MKLDKLFKLALLLSLAMPTWVLGQEHINSAEANQRSYQYFAQKDWQKLIQLADSTEKEHIAFFYLSYRFGIAHYELKHYATAEKYFREAMSFNSADTILQEYLYYSYLFQEKYPEAQHLLADMPEATQKRLMYKKHAWVSGIYIEGGRKVSSNNSLVGNLDYLGINLSHRIGSRLYISQGISQLRQKAYWGEYTQSQYFLSPNIYLGKSWMLNLTGGYIGLKPTFLPNTSESTFFDNTIGTTYNYTTTTAQHSNTADLTSIYAGISKNIGKWSLSPYFAYSKSNTETRINTLTETRWSYDGSLGGTPTTGTLPDAETTSTSSSDETYLQYGLRVQWRPFHYGLKLTGMAGNVENNGKNSLLVKAGASVPITSRLTLLGEYFYTDKASYFLENYGTTMYNSFDPMKHRFITNVQWAFSPKVQANITYLFEDREEFFRSVNYQYNSIFLGLKLNF